MDYFLIGLLHNGSVFFLCFALLNPTVANYRSDSRGGEMTRNGNKYILFSKRIANTNQIFASAEAAKLVYSPTSKFFFPGIKLINKKMPVF
jgi:hypothetical protein